MFRDGWDIASFKAREKTDTEMMTGRENRNAFPPKPVGPAPDAPPVIELRALSRTNRLNGISLSVRPAEAVGLGGMDGRGRRELRLAMFWGLRGVSGDILIDGKPARIASPRDANSPDIGMALIPEDRKIDGLMPGMSMEENLGFAALDHLGAGGAIDRAKETAEIDKTMALPAIRADGAFSAAGSLSGGNRQKLVIAKWPMTAPRIILLNDPIRGFDVGAKQEICRLMRNLADAGAAIVFYPADYVELIGCCDRAPVLYDGPDRGGERMSDWRDKLADQRATLLAGVLFAIMFTVSVSNHPAGFTANVAETAAHKGVLLAFGAMAQLFVLLTAGIDLSAGLVFIPANCVGSCMLAGSPAQVGVLLTGIADAGGLRGAERRDRDLLPPAADHRHHRRRRGVLRADAAAAALSRNHRRAGRGADRQGLRPDPGRSGVPFRRRSGRLGAVPPVHAGAHGLCGRIVAGRGLHVGAAGARGAVLGLRAVGVHGGGGRIVPDLHHPFGRGGAGQWRHLHVVFIIAAAVLSGVSLYGGRGSAVGAAVSDPQPPRSGQAGARDMSMRKTAWAARIDSPIATAFCCIIALLLIGSLCSDSFLSPAYLVQQLKVASFPAVIATGMMRVIVLGHIDLSAPWLVTTGAMTASAATAYGPDERGAGHPLRRVVRQSPGIVSGLGSRICASPR